MDAPSPDSPSSGPRGTPDDTHRQQAASLWARWRGQPPLAVPPGGAQAIPDSAPLPAAVLHHYRSLVWVAFEQRLLLLVLGSLLASVALVGSFAWHLRARPPVVLRAAPSLKEEAALFYGAPEVSYDQLAFFLQACLPLLYAADEHGHPLLALVEGLVAPEIYRVAESRLRERGAELAAHRMTQTLALSAISQVVTDAASGRAAADVRGELIVTVRQAAARVYPWRGRVVLDVNPPSRLNPYPFYVLALDERTGPAAEQWDDVPAPPPSTGP